MGIWWLSFADPDRPKGEQFLGVAIVRASGMGPAVTTAHVLKINPGGEVQGVEIPKTLAPPDEWIGRLLSREEIVDLEKIMETL